jgi:hypothetical protein
MGEFLIVTAIVLLGAPVKRRVIADVGSTEGDHVVVFPSYYKELIQGQNLKLVFVSDKHDYWKLGADPLAVFEFPTAEEAESRD